LRARAKRDDAGESASDPPRWGRFDDARRGGPDDRNRRNGFPRLRTGLVPNLEAAPQSSGEILAAGLSQPRPLRAPVPPTGRHALPWDSSPSPAGPWPCSWCSRRAVVARVARPRPRQRDRARRRRRSARGGLCTQYPRAESSLQALPPSCFPSPAPAAKRTSIAAEPEHPEGARVSARGRELGRGAHRAARSARPVDEDVEVLADSLLERRQAAGSASEAASARFTFAVTSGDPAREYRARQDASGGVPRGLSPPERVSARLQPERALPLSARKRSTWTCRRRSDHAPSQARRNDCALACKRPRRCPRT
jgi:hypothetical protein